MTKTGPKRTDISVRAVTFARLKAAARANGEQMRTYVEGLIAKALDEQEKKP